jgi:hypothetical protein
MQSLQYHLQPTIWLALCSHLPPSFLHAPQRTTQRVDCDQSNSKQVQSYLPTTQILAQNLVEQPV